MNVVWALTGLGRSAARAALTTARVRPPVGRTTASFIARPGSCVPQLSNR